VNAMINNFDEKDVSQEAWDKLVQIETTIKDPGSLHWSNKGDKLAFSAALDGTSTDVYVVDNTLQNITRLTSGSKTQAVKLGWSPDDKYVIHQAASFINPGTRSGPGMDTSGMWVAETNGQSVYQILSGDDYLIRWSSNEEILTGSWNMDCPLASFRLRETNVRTREIITILSGMFDEADVDPETKTILVSTGVKEEYLGYLSCPELIDPGVYLFEHDVNLPNKLEYFTEDLFPEPIKVYWSKIINRFILETPEGVRFVNTTGEVSTPVFINATSNINLRYIPSISPYGQYWIFNPIEESGLWIRSEDGTIKKIFDKEVCGISWRPDGKAFFINGCEVTGSLYFAEAPEFIVREVASNLSFSYRSTFQWIT
jgi:dipeptidyl aminopeptidase/acylaminoacyl peptidase